MVGMIFFCVTDVYYFPGFVSGIGVGIIILYSIGSLRAPLLSKMFMSARNCNSDKIFAYDVGVN